MITWNNGEQKHKIYIWKKPNIYSSTRSRFTLPRNIFAIEFSWKQWKQPHTISVFKQHEF